MPSKNRVKWYVADSIYHCYNRGVEKRIVFRDGEDYLVFLSYLKEYLSLVDKKSIQNQLSNLSINYKKREKLLRQLEIKNYADRVSLLAYCLMPNHFHILVREKIDGGAGVFSKKLTSGYTQYFNLKNERKTK